MEQRNESDRIMLFIRIGVSVSVLAAALFVILSQRFTEDYSKWAFGMVGLVVGYWLR